MVVQSKRLKSLKETNLWRTLLQDLLVPPRKQQLCAAHVCQTSWGCYHVPLQGSDPTPEGTDWLASSVKNDGVDADRVSSQTRFLRGVLGWYFDQLARRTTKHFEFASPSDHCFCLSKSLG